MGGGKTKVSDLNGEERFSEFSVIFNIHLRMILVSYRYLHVFELRKIFFLGMPTRYSL